MNGETGQNAAPMGPPFLGTLALVFIAIAALFFFDTIMANTEHAEGQAEAQRLFAEGQTLESSGRNGDAIEKYRGALSTVRGNRDYQLALARTLLVSGKTADAESVIEDALSRESTSGEANLMMARIQAREGNTDSAISFYHRAIFGHWKREPAKHQVSTRMELVEFLARQRMNKDLLAELILLQDEIGADPSAEMRIAQLYLVAGSPARAADMFRVVLHNTPDNADACAGLGAAEFARANYRAARAEFQTASRLKPDDAAIRKKLDQANEVLALDPMRRGLNSHERYRRSLEVLDLVAQSLSNCAGPVPATDIAEQMNHVQAALRLKIHPAEESDAAESNVDLAEKTWELRKQRCGHIAAGTDQTLDLVLAKTGQ
jgi:tetratricopeptide (TPR) repeat protein